MRYSSLLLLFSGCTITMQPSPPSTVCPPPTVCSLPDVVYVVNPSLQHINAFWKCMKGPDILLKNMTGVDYIPCEWLIDCMSLDKNQDGFLDMKDYALWVINA